MGLHLILLEDKNKIKNMLMSCCLILHESLAELQVRSFLGWSVHKHVFLSVQKCCALEKRSVSGALSVRHVSLSVWLCMRCTFMECVLREGGRERRREREREREMY